MGVAMSIAIAGQAGVAGSASGFHRVWVVLAVWMVFTAAFFLFTYPRQEALDA